MGMKQVLVISHDGYKDWVPTSEKIIEVEAFTPLCVASAYFVDDDPEHLEKYLVQESDKVIYTFGEENGVTFVKLD